MRLLIRRYVTAEQRKRDDFGITEDDVMEIRQDISTLRYELIDILRQNGMQTPDVDKQDAARESNENDDTDDDDTILNRDALNLFNSMFQSIR